MKKIMIFTLFAFAFSINANAETKTNEKAEVRVSNISTSSATLYLTNIDKLKITSVDNIYTFLSEGSFKYTETNKVCITIYPTPEECLPKQIKTGTTSANVTGLKPNTKYTAWFYRDSSIRCITTPCPSNEWQSDNITFTTLPLILNNSSSTSTSTNSTSTPKYYKKINRDIWYRTRNADVKLLQEILIKLGFLKGEATGFFGNDTFKAVKKYQKDIMQISPTGKVGPLTRDYLSKEHEGDDDFKNSSTSLKIKDNDDSDKNKGSSTKSSKEKEDKHNENGNKREDH